MSQKLYTLIRGDAIKAAPQTKIIPSEEFSLLLDAQEVLKQIKEDAENYRVGVVQEIETLKERGFQEGYQEGYRLWAEALVSFEAKLEELRKETEQAIVPVALAAAKKIVGREIELSEETVVDIVLATLKGVIQHKKIVVYVNKKELEILEKHKQKLRDLFENLESLSIKPRDDVQPGGCIIETEVGIINAQMDHRWAVLEKAFQTLIKS